METNIKIFDGHNDTLTTASLAGKDGPDIFVAGCPDIHIDLPKSVAGSLVGGCFAVFVDAPEGIDRLSHAYSAEMADKYIDLFSAIEARSNGKLKFCRSYSDIDQAFSDSTLAALLHFEGAEPIAEDLSDLQYWYDRGLRSLGICWSRQNVFGRGVGFGFGNSSDNGPGLSAAGKELVRQCNHLGIMLDVSHLNAKGLADTLNISTDPVVISHGCCWELCSSPRNYTDDQIKAVADSGGLIGVNFYVGFLRSDGKDDPNTSLSEIVRHIDRIVNLVGIDHVALGSDFDGARIPVELQNAAGLQKIIKLLSQSGYSQSEIKKIASKNWLKVIQNII